ncbi:hypothetical protein GCM10027168_70620 [Streptomyces capparidis]
MCSAVAFLPGFGLWAVAAWRGLSSMNLSSCCPSMTSVAGGTCSDTGSFHYLTQRSTLVRAYPSAARSQFRLAPAGPRRAGEALPRRLVWFQATPPCGVGQERKVDVVVRGSGGFPPRPARQPVIPRQGCSLPRRPGRPSQ